MLNRLIEDSFMTEQLLLGGIAQSSKNSYVVCVPIEDSDQSVLPPSLHCVHYEGLGHHLVGCQA